MLNLSSTLYGLTFALKAPLAKPQPEYPQHLLSFDQHQQILALLTEAGQLALKAYQAYQQSPESLERRLKADQTPVTEADLKVHELIVSRLAQITPHIVCVSEESEASVHHHRDHTAWLIDPIDGTQQFIDQTGEFSINLALVHGKQARLGYIVFVVDQLIFLQNPEAPEQLSVQHFSGSREALIPKTCDQLTFALSARSKKSDETHYTRWCQEHLSTKPNFKRAGSSFKFRMILEGRALAYPCPYPTSEWDTAAGQALIEAAGGKLLSVKGEPFKYLARSTLKNASFICLAPGFDPKHARELISINPA